MIKREQHQFAKRVSKILKDHEIPESERDEWGNPYITEESLKRLPKSLVSNYEKDGLHRIVANRNKKK